jgi:hypothetical protein
VIYHECSSSRLRLFKLRWNELARLLLHLCRSGALDPSAARDGFGSGPSKYAEGRTEKAQMTERNHMHHPDLVLLGKTLLLLVERQELLVDLRAMTQRTEDRVPIEAHGKDPEWSDVRRRKWWDRSDYGQQAATKLAG